MNRFRNLLLVVPGDGTDIGPAMKQATALALRNDAQLTLIDTVAEVPKRQAKRGQRQGIDLQAALVGDRRRELEELADANQSAGLAIEVSVGIGTPFVNTIQRVLEHGYDLVITPEEAGLTGFGARTKHLLRKCPCPVWVVRPGREGPLKILAAVDPTSEAGGDPLSRLIMDLAISMTALHGGNLDIVHAWEMEGEATLRGSKYVSISPHELDLLVERTHNEHQDSLDALVADSDLSSIDHEVHLVKGDPRRVILAMLVEKKIDLVIMGTVARTGIAGLVIGNTAESILDVVDCSVVAVKPDGFVSPVAISR